VYISKAEPEEGIRDRVASFNEKDASVFRGTTSRRELGAGVLLELSTGVTGVTALTEAGLECAK